jgi:RNA-directed DNA polymerase
MYSKKGLSFLLGVQFEDLIELAESASGYYQPFIKQTLKRNGKLKERLIEPSVGKLKLVQRKIKNRILEPILQKHDTYFLLYGGLIGKCNIDNARIHQGKKYHFCVDLRNFFPSITNKIVFKFFRDNGFSTDISSLLTKLVTINGHVPQGAPSSSHIANLVFMQTDYELKILCDKNNIVYSRFIDDLTFSSQIDFKELSFELLTIILLSSFKISHRKTFYSDRPVEVTGIVVKQNSLDTTDSFKQKDESLLSGSAIKSRKNYSERISKA